MNIRRPYVALLACLLLCLVSASRAQAQSETWCPSPQGDCVQIEKITPRINGEIPVPSTLTYTLQLKIQLKSTPKGTVEVRFERYRAQGRQVTSTLVAQSLVRALDRGKESVLRERLELSSAPITIQTKKEGERLRVVAVLKDGNGKEVAHSTSFNPLAGSLQIRPNPSAPTSDRVELLQVTPAPNTVLQPGAVTDFTFRFYYSVKSARSAFVNFEFGDPTDVKRGDCWFALLVPVPQGTGIAEVKWSHFFGNFFLGKTMAIAVPLRVSPLGRSAGMQEIKPFQFGKINP